MPTASNLTSSTQYSHSFRRRRYPLTDEQRRMYASEKLDNFRWVAKLLAKYSEAELCDDDLVSETTSREVAEYGTSPRISPSTNGAEITRPICRSRLQRYPH